MMEINYTLMPKETEKIKKNTHLDLFKKSFYNVTEDSFQITLDRSYKIGYKVNYEAHKEMFTIMLFFNENPPLKAARIISEVNNNLVKNGDRKDFYIVTTWDDASKYFCNSAFPLVAEFERKIRKLVYVILLKIFGPELYDKTIKNRVKLKGNKSELIESFLSKMDMDQLKTYLFEPYPDCPFDSINEKYSEQEIRDMPKDKLIELITPCLKKSLWDRYFKDINITLDDLTSIKDFRNQIAHNKELHYNEYIAFKKLIKSVTSKISSAIENVVNREFEKRYIDLGIVAFNYFVAHDIEVKKVAAGITEFVKQLNEPIKTISGDLVSTMFSLNESIEAIRTNMVAGVSSMFEQIQDEQQAAIKRLAELPPDDPDIKNVKDDAEDNKDNDDPEKD